MFNSFDPKIVGNTVSMETEFYNASGVKIIPDSVSLYYKTPAGTIVEVAIVEVDGKYAHSVLLDLPGIWYFRWECTGANASADEFQLTVKDTLVK